MPTRRVRPVPAVARAIRLLQALGDGRPEATLTELARRVGIHKSTAYGILATLAAEGVVERDPATRRYRLGRSLAALARAAGGPDIRVLARPHLARLRRLSGETVAVHEPDGRERHPGQRRVAPPAEGERASRPPPAPLCGRRGQGGVGLRPTSPRAPSAAPSLHAADDHRPGRLPAGARRCPATGHRLR